MEEIIDPVGLLRFRAVIEHEHEADIVANDGMLVLQVVVKAQPLRGQVLANDGHAEIGAFLSAILFGKGIPKVACLVGAALGFHEQSFPLFVG